MNLQDYRQEIENIDRRIIDLLAARKRCVEGVAKLKAESGMAARQPARFQAVLDRCRQLAAANGFDPDVVEAIWVTMHEYFVRLEEAELNR